MKVIIRDVGQGDSILIEWVDKFNNNRIGIIDCHEEKNNVNNVVHYILNRGYTCIDFIIMTHPHYDHYSGLLSFLQKLKKIEGFFVKNFFHSYLIHSENEDELLKILKSFHKKKTEEKNDPIELSDLTNLTNFLILNSTNFNDNIDSLIINTTLIAGSCDIVLSDSDYNIRILAPRGKEYIKYRNKEIKKEEFKKNKKEGVTLTENVNNPDANLLSIISCIIETETKKCISIFTSDCIKSLLPKVKKVEDKINNVNLSNINLIQVPHHGSFHNHNDIFWNNLALQDSVSFISAGKSIYNHPNPNVVEFWERLVSNLYRTDLIDYCEMSSRDLIDFFALDHTEFVVQNNIILNYDKEKGGWIRNIE